MNLYIVRHYDGFDNVWIDVSKPVSALEAKEIWNKYTHNGTRMTKYDDIDYYSIFPANTRMLWEA